MFYYKTINYYLLHRLQAAFYEHFIIYKLFTDLQVISLFTSYSLIYKLFHYLQVIHWALPII